MILVPSPHASVITRWRAAVGAADTEFVLPHVTLLPPVRVPTSSLDEVERHLADVAAGEATFSMHLAGTDTFRPVSPVVFVRVTTGAEQCARLESAVRRGPLARELDFPFHPHVTVAHDVPDSGLDEVQAGLTGFVARFPVPGIALFERGKQGWTHRADFALTG